jgi:prevent-host-death family protein
MTVVDYGSVQKRCSAMLKRVEATGNSIEIVKQGRPILRLVPIDEETRALFELRRKVSRKRVMRHRRPAR